MDVSPLHSSPFLHPLSTAINIILGVVRSVWRYGHVGLWVRARRGEEIKFTPFLSSNTLVEEEGGMISPFCPS